MSAFFAILYRDSTAANPELEQRLLDRIKYRGEGEGRLFRADPITFGVMPFCFADDTAKEVQPHTMDGVTIAGDIYLSNRPDLIRSLSERTDAALQSLPDAALVLHAYNQWGEDCPTHLIGTFSFVIWDTRRQSLMMAVDHMGLTSLYYAVTSKALIVSNELSVVRMHPLVSSDLNEIAIAYKLLLRDYRKYDKTRTPFAHIRQFGPALRWNFDASTYLNGGEIGKPTAYWSLPVDEPMLIYPRLQDYVAHYRDLLLSIIRDSIRSKDLVIALSGGIDSPSMAAAVRLLTRQGLDVNLHAINQGFHYLHPDVEPYYAWLVARKLDVPITFIQSDSYPLEHPLDALIDLNVLYQKGLIQYQTTQARQHGKIIWYGDGPDEAFFTMPLIYLLDHLRPLEVWKLFRLSWKITGKRPGLAWRQYLSERRRKLRLKRSGELPPEFTSRYPAWLNPDFERRANIRALWEAHWATDDDLRHPTQPYAHHYVTRPNYNPHLELVNPTGMLPIREYQPFLDVRMLRFAMSLPPQLSLTEKHIMREAMRGILPDQVLDRPKVPFGARFTSMLRMYGAEWIDTWTPYSDTNAYIRREAVPPLLGWNVTNDVQASNMTVLLLDNWLRGIGTYFHP